MAQVKSSPGAKPREQLQRGEARPVSVGRFQEGEPGAVGGAIGGGAGHVTRTDTAQRLVGGVSSWGVVYANRLGSPANRGARGGAGLGPDAGRRAGSGLGRLELAERFCRQSPRPPDPVCPTAGPRLQWEAGGGAARPRGRSLRRRPPPAAPSQRTPCIRSLPRPRVTAIPSFP